MILFESDVSSTTKIMIWPRVTSVNSFVNYTFWFQYHEISGEQFYDHYCKSPVMCTEAFSQSRSGTGARTTACRPTVVHVSCSTSSSLCRIFCAAAVLQFTIYVFLRCSSWIRGTFCPHWDVHQSTCARDLIASLVRDCLQLPLAFQWDVLLLWSHEFPRLLIHQDIGYF